MFVDVMAVIAWLLEKEEGAITMGMHTLPTWYCKEDIPSHLAEHEGVAKEMDELHKRKIDLCDKVFVLNVGDYIGESTRSEIDYANKIGKPIRYYCGNDSPDLKRRIK